MAAFARRDFVVHACRRCDVLLAAEIVFEHTVLCVLFRMLAQSFLCSVLVQYCSRLFCKSSACKVTVIAFCVMSVNLPSIVRLRRSYLDVKPLKGACSAKDLNRNTTGCSVSRPVAGTFFLR